MASIASYADTAWNAAGTSFTTSSSITWSAGDLVLAICGIEDAGATINTPTFSGGTFSPVDSNTAASTANAKSFQCTPASGGSGTVNFTTSVSKQGGISVWVITSTSGLGDHKEQHTTSKTVASTRQGTGPSVYVWCCLDFSGDGVGSGTPTPTNQRRAVAGNSDYDIADLINVTTNQSYGEGATGGSAGPFTLLVMEAMDAAAGGHVFFPSRMPLGV